ncbi:helix-turn-helix transcriptional regulator [Paenibacillus senegalensis]|uniref:helix-turn-helix transcriptional regulator n=1 Tax=Paenibacillus senegalensis TaxID=1465766 RepID=UPI00028A142C|nr:YafY family protein [Paenibacillus senegalensis]
MAKSKRLIELMMAVNKRRTFNAKELAEEFGVSVRTILRDLQELSSLGVPFYSTVGPHGGYTMITERMLPPIAFTEDEALAIFFASHALRHYAYFPFEAETESVLRKFYSYMSEDVRKRIDQMRQRFDLVTPMRHVQAPYLEMLLNAAIDQKVVRIEYQSRQARQLRDIQPVGVYASSGLWYCPAYCFERRDFRLFRCDRVRSIAPSEQAAIDLSHVHTGNWESFAKQDGTMLDLHVELTPLGVQRCEAELWPAPKMHISIQSNGYPKINVRADGSGWLDNQIPESSIPFFGRFFIGLGADAMVKKPVALVEFMRKALYDLAAQYEGR